MCFDLAPEAESEGSEAHAFSTGNVQVARACARGKRKGQSHAFHHTSAELVDNSENRPSRWPCFLQHGSLCRYESMRFQRRPHRSWQSFDALSGHADSDVRWLLLCRAYPCVSGCPGIPQGLLPSWQPGRGACHPGSLPNVTSVSEPGSPPPPP